MKSGRSQAKALLLDMDGVVRRWDRGPDRALEARHGLAPGTLQRTALDWARARPAVSGEVTHAQWMAGVAEALADHVGGSAAARALIEQWEAYRGEVDPDALALAREARAAGLPVGLATNATDRLDDDLALLGLAGEFDAVFNSSAMRVLKPSREYFRLACEGLGVAADACLLVDDSDRCVLGARAAGLSALRWSGPGDLPYLRAALGLRDRV